ncbi:MAG: hypothetical protein OEN50_12250, partial [Deltaproteobacteria bacterium]|nr:hypothetical protein [Deltaproteobacteria bacterium]
KVARNVKNLIKPLKGALHGLSQAMGLVARTVQNVINGVINAWNKLPLLPDLTRVRIKNYFVIPAFDIELPNVNLTVSDEAYAAVRTVAESSANMANEARTTLKTLTDLVRFWLRLMLFILLLLVVWSVLAIIGHLDRCRQRLAVGWRMIRGEAIENPLALL